MPEASRDCAPAHPVAPDPASFVRAARQRFIAVFTERWEAMHVLADASGDGRPDLATLERLTHRMAGLAGSVGFPLVSERAFEMESVLADRVDRVEASRVHVLLSRIRDAFVTELSAAPPWPEPVLEEPVRRLTVCVVEDDPEQRALTAMWVERAGHHAVALDGAEALLGAVHALRPSVILLDVNMPGLNGFAACHTLKADPDLAGIPVIFMTSRTTLCDRLTGLVLGADDYLCKPLDPTELALRLQLLELRHAAGARQSGLYGDSAPSPTPVPGVTHGCPDPRGLTLMVVDDDPDVARLVEEHTRLAGFQTVVCVDGEEARNTISVQRPDVIVLDLALPSVSGFELLEVLMHLERPPRVLVLSARNREQDVVRAFELGAHDYVTKPFNPRELVARINRLVAMLPNESSRVRRVPVAC